VESIIGLALGALLAVGGLIFGISAGSAYAITERREFKYWGIPALIVTGTWFGMGIILGSFGVENAGVWALFLGAAGGLSWAFWEKGNLEQAALETVVDGGPSHPLSPPSAEPVSSESTAPVPLRICPHCRKAIDPDRKQFCNHCGQRFPPDLKPPPQTKIGKYLEEHGRATTSAAPKASTPEPTPPEPQPAPTTEVAPEPTPSRGRAFSRLGELDELRAAGAITDEEYAAKRAKIIEDI
jgi:hypothetical protein